MISVVLATHNEEKNIESCLKAVALFADEIIVVDGESTDQTVSLAKKLGAKVTSTTNKSNFHINKQMAMDLAKGELILQLDADEVVDAELANFITSIHKNIEQQSDKAWYIPRKNYFLGRFLTKGGQYPDPVIRLYIQGFARLPQKDVHEQMVVDGPVGMAKGHLLHYSNPTFDAYVRKFNTYTTFKAKQLQEEGLQISVWSGISYIFLKPVQTTFWLLFRHKGILDGIPGIVFAVMSGMYFAVSFLKLWELTLHD